MSKTTRNDSKPPLKKVSIWRLIVLHIVLVPEAIALIHAFLRFDPAYYLHGFDLAVMRTQPNFAALSQAGKLILWIDFIRTTIPVFIFTISWRFILIRFRGFWPIAKRLGVVTAIDILYILLAFWISRPYDLEARMRLFEFQGREECARPDVLIGAGKAICPLIEKKFINQEDGTASDTAALYAWIRLECPRMFTVLPTLHSGNFDLYQQIIRLRRNHTEESDKLAGELRRRIVDPDTRASLDNTIGKVFLEEPKADWLREWLFPTECDYINDNPPASLGRVQIQDGPPPDAP